MDVDYRLAFNLAPVGLCLSRNRSIVDCNEQLCEMFGSTREQLIGQSFQILYPSADEYERLGARMTPILNAKGHYADDRIMKRANGEVFWCHVTGRALNREAPHEAGIWAFEDLSSQRPVKAELTAREREVAALIAQGSSNREIAKFLVVSERTVGAHISNILSKLQVDNRVAAVTLALQKKLV